LGDKKEYYSLIFYGKKAIKECIPCGKYLKNKPCPHEISCNKTEYDMLPQKRITNG
jgi:hypothetical protein